MITIGDLVWWSDPDNGICSKLATVIGIKEMSDDGPTDEDELTLKDNGGGITGAYRSECEKVLSGKCLLDSPSSVHDGETVTILRLVDPYEANADENGLSYYIAYKDGSEGTAYGYELKETI